MLRSKIFIIISILYINSYTMAQSRMDGSVLEGIFTYQDLEAQYQWAKNKPNYKVDEAALHFLSQHAPSLTFIVVLGTWCSDSREHVPDFYHVAKLAGIADTSMQFIGTLRNKRTTFIDLEPMCIEYVPTFFAFYNGQSIGKIVESPTDRIETDLAKMLKTYLEKTVSPGK
jgi:hypothetical protein